MPEEVEVVKEEVQPRSYTAREVKDRVAMVKVAVEVLGYAICHAHFPPAVMLSEDDQNWECPECKNTKHTGAEWGHQ